MAMPLPTSSAYSKTELGIEAEIMEHAKVHAEKAHGMKEIWPETERMIKANIKSTSVECLEKCKPSIIYPVRKIEYT